MDDLSSGQIFALTNGTRVAWALAALYAAVQFSRLLDLRNGTNFQDIAKLIQSDPRAAARYYGHRWLGICIVVGWVLS